MITIVGAGIGGLTLASVLHRNGITAVVYDADLSAASRPQGGMLDIHEDTGQAALRAAGLLEAFGKLTLEHGDAMRILDKTGAGRMAHEGNGLRPEIDRGALRNLLLSSLPPGLVRWNARVTGISSEESGFELSFADGSVATAGIRRGGWGMVKGPPAGVGGEPVLFRHKLRRTALSGRRPEAPDSGGPGW
jgi:2-polyprenyl-6-methoxyphenol hydroxylase-like FAD-dependent oxidoreductase